jgi:hypothetical protein
LPFNDAADDDDDDDDDDAKTIPTVSVKPFSVRKLSSVAMAIMQKKCLKNKEGKTNEDNHRIHMSRRARKINQMRSVNAMKSLTIFIRFHLFVDAADINCLVKAEIILITTCAQEQRTTKNTRKHLFTNGSSHSFGMSFLYDDENKRK